MHAVIGLCPWPVKSTDTWMASCETCFLCFVQHGAWFWKCLWEYRTNCSLDYYWASESLEKSSTGVSYNEKKMEKQETKRVLDNIYLRMPKQQEIFTTVAIVCNPCITATRDSQLCKMFLQLFCFEQVKTLKNFSQKLYTKDKQEKKKQRQEVTVGTT